MRMGASAHGVGQEVGWVEPQLFVGFRNSTQPTKSKEIGALWAKPNIIFILKFGIIIN
jgi:hypothetical protein